MPCVSNGIDLDRLIGMRTKAIQSLVFLLMASLALLAQSASVSVGTGFDVVSIRQDRTFGKFAATPPLAGGRLRFRNLTIKDIMSLAYPVDILHMYGGPAWIGAERYDIEAVTSESAASEDRYHQMLRAMLADRFKLVVHMDARQEPVYDLVPDKKGMRLKATPEGACIPAPPDAILPPDSKSCGHYSWDGTHLEGTGMTTATLARFLGLMAGRPVIDKSGHVGMIDIKLDFTPAYKLSSDPDAPPSIFSAVREQLGLRLQSGTGPVDVLIIDRVEKPSEN